MDISVVIPAYNAATFINESVRSALDSTKVSVEVIVVDDGSTDQIMDVLNKIKDNGLKVIQTKNKGVASARNTGIEAAKGKYIAFLDADDVFYSDNLSTKFYYLEEHPNAALVYSAVSVFDDRTGEEIDIKSGKRETKLVDFLEYNENGIYCPTSVLVRKKALEAVGNFDTTFSTAADLDLWLRLAKYGEIGYIDKPLVRYRVHQSQMHFNIPLMERDNLKIFKKYTWPAYFYDKRHYDFCLAKFLLILSLNYAGHTKNFYKALIVFFKSIIITPIPFISYLKSKIFN